MLYTVSADALQVFRLMLDTPRVEQGHTAVELQPARSPVDVQFHTDIGGASGLDLHR